MVVLYDRTGRVMRSSSAQYSGEKIPGDLAQWKYYDADPASFIALTYDMLSSMSSTLYHTTEIGGAIVNKQLDYILGPGLSFKSRIKENILGLTKDVARSWSAKFEDLLNIYKESIGYNDKLRQLALDALITGDSIAYFLPGDPFELEVEGGHIIDSRRNEKSSLLGCLLDNFSRPVGFFRKNEKSPVMLKSQTGEEQAILFSFPMRSQQIRGHSVFFRMISRIKGIDRWWDATMHRAVMEAIMIGYANAPSSDIAGQASSWARAAKGESADEEVKGSSVPMTPGVFELGNREALTFTDIKTPSNNFATANAETRIMAAMGAAIPPEVLTGQYGSSYSASKNALNDFERRIHVMRQSLIDFDKKINLRLLRYFVKSGHLKINGRLSDKITATAYLQGVWHGPRIGHVNPLQEVKALKEAVDAGFIPPAQAAEFYGNDFDDMVDQLFYEKKQLRGVEENEDDKN